MTLGGPASNIAISLLGGGGAGISAEALRREHGDKQRWQDLTSMSCLFFPPTQQCCGNGGQKRVKTGLPAQVPPTGGWSQWAPGHTACSGQCKDELQQDLLTQTAPSHWHWPLNTDLQQVFTSSALHRRQRCSKKGPPLTWHQSQQKRKLPS